MNESPRMLPRRKGLGSSVYDESHAWCFRQIRVTDESAIDGIASAEIERLRTRKSTSEVAAHRRPMRRHRIGANEDRANLQNAKENPLKTNEIHVRTGWQHEAMARVSSPYMGLPQRAGYACEAKLDAPAAGRQQVLRHERRQPDKDRTRHFIDHATVPSGTDRSGGQRGDAGIPPFGEPVRACPELL